MTIGHTVISRGPHLGLPSVPVFVSLQRSINPREVARSNGVREPDPDVRICMTQGYLVSHTQVEVLQRLVDVHQVAAIAGTVCFGRKPVSSVRDDEGIASFDVTIVHQVPVPLKVVWT